MSSRHLLPLLALAAALRVYGVWIPQFWYDENFTLIVSRLPIERMIAATAGDVHPPLYYLITWVISQIAPAAPPWVLRLPSVLFSLVSIILLYLVMRELRIPEKVQIGALLMMVLLPMQVWYAQEARMYALLEMLVLFALLFVLRGHWIGAGISAALLLYTQNYGAFYIAALGIVVLLWDRRSLPHAVITFGLAVAAYCPWVRVILSQMDSISGRYWIQDNGLGDVLNILYKQFWAASMPSFMILAALMVTFIALAVGLLHMAHDGNRHKWIVIVMSFAPLLLGWIVTVLWQPVLLHRPLIGTAPFLYIIAAWSLSRLFEMEQAQVQREAVLAAALIIPVLTLGVGGYYRNIPDMKNDGAVSPLITTLDYVRDHWQDGDIIVYADDGPMINLSPYADDLPQYLIPACGERVTSGPVLGSLTPATREAIGIPTLSVDEVQAFRRAWVFAPFSPLHPQCYEDYIAPITRGDPLLVVDNNQYIFSGVWLIRPQNGG